MKKIFTLCSICTFALVSLKSNAQFSENFDGGLSSLSSNCWLLNQVGWTNTPADVINGTGSINNLPPVNSSTTRDLSSPALTITSTSLTVSFNYKLSTVINGNATRTIEIGLLDGSNNYTSLATITNDKNTPTTVISYSNTFTVTTGVKRLVLKFGGANGDGNTRLIFDDLSTSASAKYGPTSHCNNAPIAVNDTYFGKIGSPVSGNIISNDNEPDGESITVALVVDTHDGTLTLNANGTFTFVPKPNFSGPTTTFTYQLTDNGLDPAMSNIATVTILYTAAGPLPVKLNSFQGSKNKSNVQLQWNVGVNEIANEFQVERSTDGKNFEAAAVMFATEKTGNEVYNYSEINETSKVYYRLKMTDESDVVSYSKVLMFSSVKSSKPLNIIGNIVSDRLTFSYEAGSNSKVEISVLDINGKTIVKQSLTANKGNNMASISLPSSLTSGMYIATLSADNTNSSAKFIKQ